MESQTRARQQRWAQRGHRRLPHLIALVKEILYRQENFQTARDAARNKCIKCEVFAKPKQILIIVKLRTGRTALKSNRCDRRVRITRLKGEPVPRHLWDLQSFKCNVRRKTDDACVRKQVSRGETP